VTAGSFTHHDAGGQNTFKFSGRVGGKKLKPGSYRLRATPRANKHAGLTATAGFKIIAG
jgi:hypothetical protein